MNRFFQVMVQMAAEGMGSPMAFNLALAGLGLWVLTGPMVHFGEGWQLFVNTSTTILTFVLAFLLQTFQRRHARRLHLKLDELLRAYKILHVRQRLIKLEEAPESELHQLEAEFKTAAAQVS